jgi:hypothetical protein
MMDQSQLDQSNIAERYVTGRLPAEERAGFDAHFVDCAECLDRIEAAEALRRGMSALKPSEQRRPPPYRFRQWRATALALAASIVLLLGIEIGGRLRGANSAKSELDAERMAATSAQRQLEEAQASLRQEREARSALEKELARDRQPQLQVPVYELIAMRGDEIETLPVPPVPQWMVVSFERENPPRFDRYRVTLLYSNGKQLWQGEARPISREMLALGLHSSLLPPGTYVFQLQGITKAGSLVPITRHPIRVASPAATPH